MCLRLSAADKAVQGPLYAEARLLNERAVDGLSAAERARLVALLTRVKANIDGPE